MNTTTKLFSIILGLLLASISVSATMSIPNGESVEYFTIHQAPGNAFPYQRVFIQGTQPCCNYQSYQSSPSYNAYYYYQPMSYGYRYYAHGYSYQRQKHYRYSNNNNGPSYSRTSQY
ncbi:MAG: hypothetical protein Q7R96_00215 [Nanoarchaeota archaeon]|nr:hypothetical protein [Nanoarchaeota archaeon]